MPQYKLKSLSLKNDGDLALWGDPDFRRLRVLTTMTKNDVSRITISAKIKTPDGRAKTFSERFTLNEDEASQINPGSGLWTPEILRLREEIQRRHAGEIDILKAKVCERAEAWWDLQRASLNFVKMARMETLITGLYPARLIPHISQFKYAWIKSLDDPSEAAETIVAFSREAGPGERLVKLITGQPVPASNSTSSSIYVLVTPENYQELRRKIIELQRIRVERKLGV